MSGAARSKRLASRRDVKETQVTLRATTQVTPPQTKAPIPRIPRRRQTRRSTSRVPSVRARRRLNLNILEALDKKIDEQVLPTPPPEPSPLAPPPSPQRRPPSPESESEESEDSEEGSEDSSIVSLTPDNPISSSEPFRTTSFLSIGFPSFSDHEDGDDFPPLPPLPSFPPPSHSLSTPEDNESKNKTTPMHPRIREFLEAHRMDVEACQDATTLFNQFVENKARRNAFVEFYIQMPIPAIPTSYFQSETARAIAERVLEVTFNGYLKLIIQAEFYEGRLCGDVDELTASMVRVF